MDKRVIRYPIASDKVYSHFIEHITTNLAFEGFEKYVDFSKGSFFTFLPEGVSEERVLKFEMGEITPSIPYNGDPSKRRVVTYEYECSEFIWKFMRKNPDSKLIVENYNDKGLNPTKIDNVEINLIDDEPFYVLNRENSIEEIYNATRRCSIIWHLLSFVTNIEESLLPLSRENIPEICKVVAPSPTCCSPRWATRSPPRSHWHHKSSPQSKPARHSRRCWWHYNCHPSAAGDACAPSPISCSHCSPHAPPSR